MANLLHRVSDNYYYWTGQIVPTDAIKDAAGKLFRPLDPLKERPKNSSAMVRRFWVTRLGADTDKDFSNGSNWRAEHEYEMRVVYPDILGHRDRERLIAADRNDLIDQLRSGRNNLGFDADNLLTDVGICLRERSSDEVEIDEEDQVAILRIVWRTIVKEST